MRVRRGAAVMGVVLVLGVTAAAAQSEAPYQWRAATGGQIRSRPVVGTDGTIYALSEDGYLYAWVPGGSLLWRHELGWIPWDCLAASDDGTVYAGLKNGDFLAVNPRGGRLWTVRLDGPPAGDPAIAADGTVLVGTAAGTLLALSHLGHRQWSVTLPAAVIQAPLVDGAGTIYLVAGDRRLYALTPWGEFKWSLPIASDPSPLSITADGTVVLGTRGGELVAVDSKGNLRWSLRLGSAVTGSAVAAQILVAGTVDGRLVAVSPDGVELWQALSGRPSGAPPSIYGDEVIQISADGTIGVFQAERGTPRSDRTGAIGETTLTAGGQVLVGGRDWIAYAVDPDPGAVHAASPTASGPWPQQGHDERHSGRTDAAPPADNTGLLDANPDYLYLQGILGAPGREGVRMFLSEIEGRVAAGSIGASRWYVARMLERVVGYGLVTQVRENQKLVNDFPDLRAQAANLLGALGSAGSRAALLRAVDVELDGLALAAEIRALGVLSTDGDGASQRAIAAVLKRRAGGPTGGRLAGAAVEALGRIALYQGSLSEPSAVRALLSLSMNEADPASRAAASILQGDLKAYILDSGE